MAYQEVTAGESAPDQVNLIIEIQKGGGRNKYETDKKTGRRILDRVNATTLGYPTDYGYVPQTLCKDGDPLDALLVIDEPIAIGTLVSARPIGVLFMIDDGDEDEKLICVATDDISKDHIKSVEDLEPNFKKRVEHFYTHVKDWKNNWQGVKVEFKGWGDASEARQVITESLERANNA
ncbi:inorganic diphosphatase [Candidatus Saccharibacteria bacterium]|nr:inorganic diphosphatase [Candidatus Saccharibacteria bacterium]